MTRRDAGHLIAGAVLMGIATIARMPWNVGSILVVLFLVTAGIVLIGWNASYGRRND